MPESRGESFYGGRFYDRTYDFGSRREQDYEVAFRASDADDAPAAYVSSTYTPDKHQPHPDSAIDWTYDHPSMQGTLFKSEPGKHEIDMAMATKDARHHIPTMLGMVAQHELKTRGKIPNASQDLSPHSTRMVQKAVDMGLVKNPVQEYSEDVFASNDINWTEGERAARWRSDDVRWYGDEVPFERVNAGRQFVRDALRRPRKYQAEQLTID